MSCVAKSKTIENRKWKRKIGKQQIIQERIETYRKTLWEVRKKRKYSGVEVFIILYYLVHCLYLPRVILSRRWLRTLSSNSICNILIMWHKHHNQLYTLYWLVHSDLVQTPKHFTAVTGRKQPATPNMQRLREKQVASDLRWLSYRSSQVIVCFLLLAPELFIRSRASPPLLGAD